MYKHSYISKTRGVFQLLLYPYLSMYKSAHTVKYEQHKKIKINKVCSKIGATILREKATG